MLGFLKIFLQGVLYVVLLPLILLLLALYAIYCIIIFIYMAIRSVIVFFMGGTPLGDLPEDVEAKRILMQRAEEAQKPTDSTQALANALVQSQLQIAQTIYAQQNNGASLDIPTSPTDSTSEVEEEESDIEMEEINND